MASVGEILECERGKRERRKTGMREGKGWNGREKSEEKGERGKKRKRGK